jgi:hypothetical protein
VLQQVHAGKHQPTLAAAARTGSCFVCEPRLFMRLCVASGHAIAVLCSCLLAHVSSGMLPSMRMLEYFIHC